MMRDRAVADAQEEYARNAMMLGPMPYSGRRNYQGYGDPLTQGMPQDLLDRHQLQLGGLQPRYPHEEENELLAGGSRPQKWF